QVGDESHAQDVAIAIFTSEAQAMRQRSPNQVAVEHLDASTASQQSARELARDRRFSRTRESRQPDGEAGTIHAGKVPQPRCHTASAQMCNRCGLRVSPRSFRFVACRLLAHAPLYVFSTLN